MTDLLDSLAKPPPPPSELDEIMLRDPLDLTSTDIDALIAMQRQARGRRESGGRTKKAGADAPKRSLTLADIGLGAAKPAVTTITPAKGGGLRRL